MNKEERTESFNSISRIESQELILNKTKDKGLEVGSGVANKKYDSEEIYELIHIANFFQELRAKVN